MELERTGLEGAFQYVRQALASTHLPPARAALWAQELVCGLAGCERLALFSGAPLPASWSWRRLREATVQLVQGKPLAYILGKAGFMDMELRVGEGVLIPREDTQTLVEAVMEVEPSKACRGLDVGTGSGCIAIALARAWPESCWVGWDISKKALAWAELNSARWQVATRLDLQCRDLRQQASWQLDQRFDVIVSNPPYVRMDDHALAADVRAWEPHTALDGGDDGLVYYQALARMAGDGLKDGGRLYLEVGYDQAEAVGALFTRAGWRLVGQRRDRFGIQRVVIVTRPA